MVPKSQKKIYILFSLVHVIDIFNQNHYLNVVNNYCQDNLVIQSLKSAEKSFCESALRRKSRVNTLKWSIFMEQLSRTLSIWMLCSRYNWIFLTKYQLTISISRLTQIRMVPTLTLQISTSVSWTSSWTASGPCPQGCRRPCSSPS